MTIPGYGQASTDTEQWQDEDGTVHGERNGKAASNGHHPERLDGVPLPAEPLDDDPGPAAPAERSRPHLREQLLTVTGLGSLPPVRPLVDGLLYRATLAQISGPPGSYKSFLTVALACSVAAGVPFEEHAVPDGGGPLVYVAAEGATGLRARVLAWCELNGVKPAELDGRLYVLPVPVQLGKVVDVAEAFEITEEIGARLLVLDTRARCTVGLEENSSTEQGKAIDAAELLVRRLGCTVLPVHHSGRGGGAGRGSNAWDGAVWSDLRVTGENLRATVGCSKHKDVPDGCEHEFRLVPHTVSEDLMPGCTEAQRRTLVIIRGDGRPVPVDHQTGRIVREIVRSGAGPEGFTRTQIVTMAEQQKCGRTQAYAAVKDLVTRGVLVNVSSTKRERFVISTAHASDTS